MQQQKLIAAQKPIANDNSIAAQKPIANDNSMSGNSAAQLGADRTNNALATIKAEKLKATIRKRNRTRRKNKKAELMGILLGRARRAKYSDKRAFGFANKIAKEIMSGEITLEDKKAKPKRKTSQMICWCLDIGCRIGPMQPI